MGALKLGYKRREPRALGFIPFAATADGNTPHNTEGRVERERAGRRRRRGREGGNRQGEATLSWFRSALLPEYHGPASALHQHPSITKHRTISLFG
jgi:hypothetical protein